MSDRARSEEEEGRTIDIFVRFSICALTDDLTSASLTMTQSLSLNIGNWAFDCTNQCQANSDGRRRVASNIIDPIFAIVTVSPEGRDISIPS